MEATITILSGGELRSKRHELAPKLHEKVLAKLHANEIAEAFPEDTSVAGKRIA